MKPLIGRRSGAAVAADWTRAVPQRPLWPVSDGLTSTQSCRSPKAAGGHHALNLARRYLMKKGGLGAGPFSAMEKEILDVLAEAVTTLRRSGCLPHDIVKSLCAGGLIAAVQRSVSHCGLLRCRTDCESDAVLRGIFEAIVNRHPTAFSAETVRLASLHAV